MSTCFECERLKRALLDSSVECVNAESALRDFARRKLISEGDGLELDNIQHSDFCRDIKEAPAPDSLLGSQRRTG